MCGRAHSQKWTQQATFFGLLVGVVASGLLSDRVGRVRAMLALLAMTVACGVATAFARSYYLFLAGVWGTGFSTIG